MFATKDVTRYEHIMQSGNSVYKDGVVVFFFLSFKSVAVLAAFDSFPKQKTEVPPIFKTSSLNLSTKNRTISIINDIILNHDFSFFL